LGIACPDQVWVADITYVHLLKEYVYLAVLMDACTHAIRGCYLGRNLNQELTLAALRRAFIRILDQIGHFLEDVYMRKRIHSSLGYLTPAELEERWSHSASPVVVS
jgi:putative transposase